VIRNAEHAFSKDGGLAVLYGNIALDGCIVKTAGVDESIRLCVWVFCLHGHLCITCGPDDQRGQKRTADPLGLELQMVVSSLWVLGFDLQSCGRAVRALNH